MIGSKRILFVIALVIAVGFSLSGCIKGDSPSGNKDKDNNPDDYFDFALTSDVKLDVNYAYPGGYKALIEVYGENPMERLENGEYVKRDDLEAIFKSYTDDNAKFTGKMSIPTDLTKVYLYTREMGLPQCVTLDVKNGSVVYDPTLATNTSNATRANAGVQGDKAPYSLTNSNDIFSLVKWTAHGHMPSDYIKPAYKVGTERMADFTQRLKNTLWNKLSYKPYNLDNSKYISSSEKANVTIAHKAADGTLIEGAIIDVVFVHERASYRNVFGYYYYKAGETPDLKTIKKYIVVPNVSVQGDEPYNSQGLRAPLISAGQKFRLQFFGEQGNSAPVDRIPAGYTIGWFIMSDAFRASDSQINLDARTTFSNNNACITLYDKKSGKMVVGFEDGTDKSYEDMLFYVEADPMKAIIDPENPGIPEVDQDGDITIPDATETTSGTLAFEDIWPWGGDYDLNDAVIEYKREVTFDKDNNVKLIVEHYKPISNGASYINAFATMYDKQLGGTTTLPAGATKEVLTGAAILYANQLDAIGKEFVLTHTFTVGELKKADIPVWNPFIIVDYKGKSEENRREVHLPKHKPTILVDKKLVLGGEDMYYVYKNGKYPFAINIPVKGWRAPLEKIKIDEAYLKYSKWVNDATDSDWYKFPVESKVQTAK